MKYVIVVLVIAITLLLAALVLIPGPEGNDKDAGKGGPDESRATGEPVADLQIIDVKVGEGEVAKDGDSISVHYTGRFLDGKQFDSSVGKSPYSFRLGNAEVIPGWDKGLIGMKVGGKRKLIVPHSLAYGVRGGNGIPPMADLKFDVELLAVQR